MKLNKTTIGLILSILVNVLGVTGVIPPAVDQDAAKCPPGTPLVPPAQTPSR